jgi:hypothetical protein
MEHEQSIDEHVDANVSMAIDQAHKYEGLHGAFDAYLQNTVDSVREDGYTVDEAFDAGNWFVTKFNRKTGLSL